MGDWVIVQIRKYVDSADSSRKSHLSREFTTRLLRDPRSAHVGIVWPGLYVLVGSRVCLARAAAVYIFPSSGLIVLFVGG